MIYKKAAMFGLDARIALAIFGALSVISGAALYSAIQSANAEKLRQYFVEVVKATEAYYLDNGSPLPTHASIDKYLYSSDLVDNRESLSTWRGHYLSATYSTSLGSSYFRDSMTTQIHEDTLTRVVLKKVSTWTKMDSGNDGMCSLGSSDCAEW